MTHLTDGATTTVPDLDRLSVRDVVLDVAHHFEGGTTDGLHYDLDASADSLQVTVTRESDGAVRTFIFSPSER